MALTKEQEEIRRTGIAATDAAAIVGLSSSWKTAADVWVEKIHPEIAATIPVDPKKKSRFEWGLLDEPALAAKYSSVTGEALVKHTTLTPERLRFAVNVNGTLRSSQIPWMLGTPDWIVAGKEKGVEGKTTEAWDTQDWGDPGSDQIPPNYLIQIYHLMMVTGFKEWACAARIGLYRFSIYNFFFDAKLSTLLYDAEEAFYNKCIKGKQRPEFDFGEKIRAYVLARYPTAKPGKELMLHPGSDGKMIAALLEHRRLALILKSAESQKDNQRTIIAALMEDAAKAKYIDEGITVSYNNPKQDIKHRIDHERLAAALLARSALSAEEKQELIGECTDEVPRHRVLYIYDKMIRESNE